MSGSKILKLQNMRDCHFSLSEVKTSIVFYCTETSNELGVTTGSVNSCV